MNSSFSRQDITRTMSSIAFSPNPKELTTICANVPTTLPYLLMPTLLWNRILFIEWFLKTFIDFYQRSILFLLNTCTECRQWHLYCNLCVYSFFMCVCHMLLKDLLTYLLFRKNTITIFYLTPIKPIRADSIQITLHRQNANKFLLWT